MSLLKDSSVFKSSGQLLLASPSSSLQFVKQDNQIPGQNYFLRPSSRGSIHPRQLFISQQAQQGQMIKQQAQEKTSFLPNLSQQLNNSSSQPQQFASRKNSLIAKNMNSEQLKDWLIGKQPSLQKIVSDEKDQNKLGFNANNSQIQFRSSFYKNDFQKRENNNKAISNIANDQITSQNQDSQPVNQFQERSSVRRTQRRAQSDIIFQRQSEDSKNNQVQTIFKNISQNKQNEENSNQPLEQNGENEQKTQTKVIIRKRIRMPSYNPTNPIDSLFNQQQNQNQQSEYQQQKEAGLLKNISQTNQRPLEFTNQQQPTEEEQNFRSTLSMFQSPNKNNRVEFSSAEPSPMKKPASMTSLMDTSSTGFHKFQIKNLINSNISNTIAIPQLQSTKNLTQRQILLKDLQNITDSRKLLEISSNNNAQFNTKLGSSQTFQNDQLNQQLGKKLTIFNSPNSSSSSPLDEMLSTSNSTSSQQNLPLIKNRQVKNISLQHIEMPSKLQIHSTVSKSSVIQSVWGSSSNIDQHIEQSQLQPKGILKNKRDSSKAKKQVVFDKTLHIFELGQNQQA